MSIRNKRAEAKSLGSNPDPKKERQLSLPIIYLEEARKKGRTIEIPSLGIQIKGTVTPPSPKHPK